MLNFLSLLSNNMAEYDVKFLHRLLFDRLNNINSRFSPYNYMKKIISMHSNIDKVNYLHADLKKCNLLPRLIKDLKNDDKANTFRDNGNKCFALGSYFEALEFYTRSLANAVSEEKFALAYANRSACLYKLELYQQCLTDIERAFAHNYPEKLKPKLIARRSMAEKALKPVEPPFGEVPEIACKNPLIQCASDSVKIEENAEFGRHVVATKTIEIGEVIAVEGAYAVILKTDQLIHCHACAILCYNPIPCKGCTMVWFCTEQCRDEAKFHEYECPILLSMLQYGMASKMLVFKTAILSRDELMNADSYKFAKNEPYRSDRYKEVHCLRAPKASNFDPELFFEALFGTVFFDLLKNHTDFFQNNSHLENCFKNEIVTLMRTIMVSGTRISEYTRTKFGYDDSLYAGGLYPFFALFNHSCCNNVIRTYHGTTIVLRAMNTIRKGEQCFVNYGHHYGTEPKFARQVCLNEDFSFFCKCRACEEDWELLGDPVIFLQNYVCQQLRYNRPRTTVQAGFTPDELLLLEKKLSSTADLDFVAKTLPKLIAQLKRCERTQPSGEVLIIQQMMNYCYQTMGNKRRL